VGWVYQNVLMRWRREFRQAPGNAFPGHGQRRWSEGRVAELERKSGQQEVRLIEGVFAAHRRTAKGGHRLIFTYVHQSVDCVELPEHVVVIGKSHHEFWRCRLSNRSHLPELPGQDAHVCSP